MFTPALILTALSNSTGNIVSGPDEYGAQAMQSGALVAAMMSYLQSMHRHIKKESLWVLSNLTAGPTEHTDALIQAGILPLIMDLMSSTYDIKKEVCSIVHVFHCVPLYCISH